MKLDLNNWIDTYDFLPPQTGADFVSWCGSEEFCRVASWSEQQKTYVDSESFEPIQFDFWFSLFPPNHKHYNQKYLRPCTEEELKAFLAENNTNAMTTSGTILSFNKARKAVN